jgi:hypothetical protein
MCSTSACIKSIWPDKVNHLRFYVKQGWHFKHCQEILQTLVHDTVLIYSCVEVCTCCLWEGNVNLPVWLLNYLAILPTLLIWGEGYCCAVGIICTWCIIHCKSSWPYGKCAIHNQTLQNSLILSPNCLCKGPCTYTSKFSSGNEHIFFLVFSSCSCIIFLWNL